ncbi:AMP-binding enzyme [Microbacterium schleiferi]|uniref:AMP-binding enzyme C-terminal domain-containing protein n=1 Tax=Microbacterium schleiferi TaxID=69362 RepID=A0ABU7V7Z3_9MICO
MIIAGGENIYPAEIENHISSIEGVTGVGVIGIPDEQWGEVPWAVITVKDGVDLDTETVRAHLGGKLARCHGGNRRHGLPDRRSGGRHRGAGGSPRRRRAVGAGHSAGDRSGGAGRAHRRTRRNPCLGPRARPRLGRFARGLVDAHGPARP